MDGVKFRVRVRVRSIVNIRVRIMARLEVRVRISVRVSISYIMTIWRWEEFLRCDKFPTTPEHMSLKFSLKCLQGLRRR